MTYMLRGSLSWSLTDRYEVIGTAIRDSNHHKWCLASSNGLWRAERFEPYVSTSQVACEMRPVKTCQRILQFHWLCAALQDAPNLPIVLRVHSSTARTIRYWLDTGQPSSDENHLNCAFLADNSSVVETAYSLIKACLHRLTIVEDNLLYPGYKMVRAMCISLGQRRGLNWQVEGTNRERRAEIFSYNVYKLKQLAELYEPYL